jgi:serine protease AprX
MIKRKKAVWGPRRAIALLALGLFGLAPVSAVAAEPAKNPQAKTSRVRQYKLDREIERRRDIDPNAKTSVIVTLVRGAKLPADFKRFARSNGKLNIISGEVLDLPNRVLRQLEAHPEVFRVHYNRPLAQLNYRTAITTGARAAQQGYGLTGAGVGVAVIDSGVATWHDDLTSITGGQYPFGNQRVSAFVDFVNGRKSPYDDSGHGTHVAGIIAGNGYSSNGQKAGMAPGAHLVSLKVLDEEGKGSISNVIAALDWVLANRTAYNIRVVNLSVGAGIHESYFTDPLTLAAKRVVDAGVVVVAAAGNRGKNAEGEAQYGGINAPGNAPWVLTVGASSTNGTPMRADDEVTTFSSRGPTYLDWSAKPDIVAPGVGTVSLADPTSRFYTSRAAALIKGSVDTAHTPYLSLSGTSMAAPAVAGTVALMLEANPSLTPNAVKAILQYTAEKHADFNALTQGAGFLNALGAARLARYFVDPQPGEPYPVQSVWSRQIIWGNHRLSGGVLLPWGNAWATSTTWGVAKTDGGDNIVWGTACGESCDNIVWGTADGDNIVWGTGDGDNIVWGTDGDDNIVWGTDDLDDNIVWGTDGSEDNIVWGTDGDHHDNIVWGTDCGGSDCDNIVWGTTDGDNIVWGTAVDGDNIVWGTDGTEGDNIVWGTESDNIVWGTDESDNIVWGTDGEDNIVWGTDDGDNIVWGTAPDGVTVWTVAEYADSLFDSYYSYYTSYLSWMTDSDFFAYGDSLREWIRSTLITAPAAPDEEPAAAGEAAATGAAGTGADTSASGDAAATDAGATETAATETPVTTDTATETGVVAATTTDALTAEAAATTNTAAPYVAPAPEAATTDAAVVAATTEAAANEPATSDTSADAAETTEPAEPIEPAATDAAAAETDAAADGASTDVPASETATPDATTDAAEATEAPVTEAAATEAEAATTAEAPATESAATTTETAATEVVATSTEAAEATTEAVTTQAAAATEASAAEIVAATTETAATTEAAAPEPSVTDPATSQDTAPITKTVAGVL